MESISIKDIFQHFKRDALAGTVTGVMAVPLTVGICLMSDYPIMTGLYTVIFACVIGFVTYLFRPGNFVGTPGVAAGLAPALALGVSSFGIHNMPFVIFLTASFQVLVWRFRWERFILQLVPSYMVEGLLAGVGLKIALKFLPFLYDINQETGVWLNLEREIIIVLSSVSLVLFVILYKYYQRRMPALPYFLIMLSGFALSFFIPLKMISIDSVPFQLAIPFPHFEGLSIQGISFLLLKMVGFALMLGTIDVIEQVMSNVAIEKLDPLKRPCDTNNSLLAIWIANLGSTFFGGMTNLDGLAKSTTNGVAGAMTKLSNLFTAMVLLVVVFFPIMLTHIPEYALGIVMVYSGWKMIANISHVRAVGRYALVMAAVCGLLVFEMGIFEGLLLVLAIHGIIQYLFIRRLGKTTREAFVQFTSSLIYREESARIERVDWQTEPQVPVLEKWIDALNRHDLETLLKLHTKDCVLLPAFSMGNSASKVQIRDYYENFLTKEDLVVRKIEVQTSKVKGIKIDNGRYGITWKSKGVEQTLVLRFSAVIKNGKFLSHHSSEVPEVLVAS